MVSDPCLMTAQDLAAAYRARSLSPVDAVEALFARIERLNPALHAFIAVYGADARLAAEAADKALRAGYDLGPLHGIPVVLKDLIAVEGRAYAAGSKVHLGRRATESATLVRKLIAAGAIILGKSHTVEFAFGGWGTNAHLGTPRNPWRADVHYTPGGSSSGSGVAVAARMAPLAVGTDTGGSVRIPASFNGITGLKVTRGRISNHGIEPLNITLDTPGPMARSVEDAALLFSAMQGPDAADPMTFGITPDDPMLGLRRGIAGLRLGRIALSDCGLSLDPETAAAYEAALETMAALGAAIVPVTLPRPVSDYAQMREVMAAEAYALHGAIADDPNTPMDPHVRARILAGKIPAADYLRRLWERPALQAAFLAAIDPVTALLLPTTPMPAQPVASVDEATAPSGLTRAANLLGLCALAVPSGMTASGLPLSLQILGRPFAEAEVLRIGWAFQQAGDWHLRLPPV